MIKILIAGDTGFIGQHLFSFLKSKYFIRGISNDNFSRKEHSKVDLTKLEEVSDFVAKNEKYDVVIFLTGLAHSKGNHKQYDDYYNVNVNTLKNLISSMNAWNKLPEKIIFSSTISTYGEKWNREIYKEEDLQEPKSPYALTKLESEKYLLSEFKGISWIVRFAPVYAENFKLNIDRRTKIKNQYYYVGRGDVKLSLLNIENIKKTVDSIVAGKIPAGIYNLSDAKIYSYQDLLEWQKVLKKLFIPRPMMYMAYLLGRLTRNNFLIENSIKLSTNNIFTSEKISKYINLDHQLMDIKCIAE